MLMSDSAAAVVGRLGRREMLLGLMALRDILMHKRQGEGREVRRSHASQEQQKDYDPGEQCFLRFEPVRFHEAVQANTQEFRLFTVENTIVNPGRQPGQAPSPSHAKRSALKRSSPPGFEGSPKN